MKRRFGGLVTMAALAMTGTMLNGFPIAVLKAQAEKTPDDLFRIEAARAKRARKIREKEENRKRNSIQ